MKTRKLLSLIVAMALLAILAVHTGVAVYADSVAVASDIRVFGAALSDLNYSSRIADVKSSTQVNPSELGITTEVQKYVDGNWTACTEEKFFSGQYRLKMRIYSTDSGDTIYYIGSDPTVKYNGADCTVSERENTYLIAYTDEFTVSATYSLTVAGKQVSTVNAADILGDGSKKFVFDPATDTLTVNGDYTYTNDSIIVNDGISGLTVNTAKNSMLTSSGSTIRCGKYDTTITGSGSLTLNSQNNCGIYITGEGTTLTIDNAELTASGQNAIAGNESSNQNLVINNSKITATGTSGAIRAFGGSITLNGCKVLTPENAQVNEFSICGSDGITANSVTIGCTEYPLVIALTTVTENNASDILGDGVFKYDPDTKTLTVNGNCRVQNGSVISSKISGLTINVAGNSVLTANNGAAVDLHKKAAVITSTNNSTLDINSNIGACIANLGYLTIKDANITVKGPFGIYGGFNGTLLINNSYINLDTFGTTDSSGALRNFENFILDDCKITSPEGAVFKDNILYENDGTTIARKVTIEPITEYPLTVAGTVVTPANAGDILGNGVFGYNSEKKTLTVKGSYYYKDDFLIRNMGIDGLTILIAADSDLHASNGSVISCGDYDTTIKGTGDTKLELAASSACITANSGDVTVENLYLEANRGTSGGYGIKGQLKGTLTIRNSEIDVRGTGAAIRDFTDIRFEGCSIDIPSYAVVGYAVYQSDGTTEATIVTTKPASCGLSVAGTSVNTLNAHDILGNGVFRYDPTAQILYVNGDCTSNNIVIWNTGIDGLTINIPKDVTLTGNSDHGIVCSKNTTITGDGTLTIDAGGHNGIMLYNTCTLTIEYADLDITNSYHGITSLYGKDTLVINASNITASGTDGAICDFKDITINDCDITSPDGAQNTGGTIYNSGSTETAAEVEIKIAEYKLKITGVSVTGKNAADVLGDGVFSFDSKTNTLTIDGDCTGSGNTVIYNEGIEDLTINVLGDSSLTHTNGAGMLFGKRNTTITCTGNHTLNIKSGGAAISCAGVLTVENANITIDAPYGFISGYATALGALVVKNSRIALNTTGMTQDSGAIRKFNNIQLDGCVITSPAGAVYKDSCLYEADGTTIARKVFISNGDVNLDGVTNNADAQLTLRHISTNATFFDDPDTNALAEKIANMDGSNSDIDMLDVIKLMKLIDSNNR
ncbi:MAG: hypothetical protein IJR59_05535 [Firmicutes bacterium]|nr:hypothetical protein [Bacillota bacterium]